MIAALRLSLLVAYLPLAYCAGTFHSPPLAALALGDLVALALVEPLWVGPGPRRRLWAGVALAVAALALVALAQSRFALVPLLLVPPLFTAMIGGWFARSLRPGREPLIAKAMNALYARSGIPLTPRHHRYTRQLTLAWALLLALMTVVNLTLALVAVPDGVLAQLGIAAPATVTNAQWSWIANIANYGLMAGFMLIEFQVRKRVFPVRPYRGFFDFARQLAGLGPAFWQSFFR